jgi:hypothetical protein
MLNRRELLRRLSSFPVIGGIVGSVAPFSVLAAPAQKTPPKRDVFKELGVRTFINAAGTYTAMTG